MWGHFISGSGKCSIQTERVTLVSPACRKEPLYLDCSTFLLPCFIVLPSSLHNGRLGIFYLVYCLSLHAWNVSSTKIFDLFCWNRSWHMVGPPLMSVELKSEWMHHQEDLWFSPSDGDVELWYHVPALQVFSWKLKAPSQKLMKLSKCFCLLLSIYLVGGLLLQQEVALERPVLLALPLFLYFPRRQLRC